MGSSPSPLINIPVLENDSRGSVTEPAGPEIELRAQRIDGTSTQKILHSLVAPQKERLANREKRVYSTAVDVAYKTGGLFMSNEDSEGGVMQHCTVAEASG